MPVSPEHHSSWGGGRKNENNNNMGTCKTQEIPTVLILSGLFDFQI